MRKLQGRNGVSFFKTVSVASIILLIALYIYGDYNVAVYEKLYQEVIGRNQMTVNIMPSEVTTAQIEENPQQFIEKNISIYTSFITDGDILLIPLKDRYIQIRYDDQDRNIIGQVNNGATGYVEGEFWAYEDLLGKRQFCINADKVVLDSSYNNIGLSYNLAEDVENGLLYSNEAGYITDYEGAVIPEYEDISVTESGHLLQYGEILEGFGTRIDGKVVKDWY